jgi:hypothetical protein
LFLLALFVRGSERAKIIEQISFGFQKGVRGYPHPPAGEEGGMRFDSRVSATEPKIPGRRIQKNIQEIKIPKRGPKKFQKRGALPKPVKPGRVG